MNSVQIGINYVVLYM